MSPRSFATILLLATDGSRSAEYARSRFLFNDDIAICGRFSSFDAELYLLITTNEACQFTGILNCNDTDDSLAGVRFSVKSGLSDSLAFSFCLRKLISKSISEFGPFDMGQIVTGLFYGLFEKFDKIEWSMASANSIFRGAS
jgi:hypothetical protein